VFWKEFSQKSFLLLFFFLCNILHLFFFCSDGATSEATVVDAAREKPTEDNSVISPNYGGAD